MKLLLFFFHFCSLQLQMHVLHHKCDNIYSPISSQPVCMDLTTVLQMKARKEPVSKFMHPFYVRYHVGLLKYFEMRIEKYFVWFHTMDHAWRLVSLLLLDKRQTADEHNQVVFAFTKWSKLRPFFHSRAGTTFFFFLSSSKNYNVYETSMILGWRIRNSNIRSCSKRKLTLI